uniref:Uncharacterized protein n=1 Tax=Sphaerodactylus townsendi TaxID=933632 RepID=A0ACB8ESR6_9SAUR
MPLSKSAQCRALAGVPGRRLSWGLHAKLERRDGQALAVATAGKTGNGRRAKEARPPTCQAADFAQPSRQGGPWAHPPPLPGRLTEAGPLGSGRAQRPDVATAIPRSRRCRSGAAFHAQPAPRGPPPGMGMLLPGERGWLRRLCAALLRRLQGEKSWDRKLDELNLLQQKSNLANVTLAQEWWKHRLWVMLMPKMGDPISGF